MSLDPVMQCFKEEFDRFFDLLLEQVRVAPEKLWKTKHCGLIYWQQIFHTIVCVQMYVEPEKPPLTDPRFDPKVMKLQKEAAEVMSKREVLELADEMRGKAHDYLSKLSVPELGFLHPALSQTLGREMTVQNALIGLIRHTCYHLGRCDAALRDFGLPGVY